MDTYDPFEIIPLTVEEFGVESIDGENHVLLIGRTGENYRVAAYANIESMDALYAFINENPGGPLVVQIERRQLAGQS